MIHVDRGNVSLPAVLEPERTEYERTEDERRKAAEFFLDSELEAVVRGQD